LQIWPVLIIWLALTPIEVIRIRREERVLKETFGEQYTQYRSRTWL
jgi:protein-S-isoprenylcysteine O-methyltransferase Ste14